MKQKYVSPCFFFLLLEVPSTTIHGGMERHIKYGSTINLTCEVRNFPEKLPYVIWYKSGEVSQRASSHFKTPYYKRSDVRGFKKNFNQRQSIKCRKIIFKVDLRQVRHANTDPSIISESSDYKVMLALKRIDNCIAEKSKT